MAKDHSECTVQNLTLYIPKRPSSFTTLRALIFVPLAISPATWRRILTISSGFVNITCEPPAWNKQLFHTSSIKTVFKGREVWRIFGPKKMKHKRGWANCVMISFVSGILHQILSE
jgi:hypothetical protein